MKLVRFILSCLGRAMLSLRYDMRIKDPSGILKGGGKGKSILFLPNHPAEIDPIIVSTLLMRTYAPRPLVVEHFYYLPGAAFFLRLVRAISIPDFEQSANSWKVARGKEAEGRIGKGIAQGDHFLIYPSGHLWREPREVVGGSSLVHSIVQEFPDLEIVLIRTRGLWGSMFSRANSDQNPDFWKNVVRGIKIALKNGIFFMPRRRLDITLERAASDFPKSASRLDMNKYLEAWYNKEGDEAISRVSYAFWKKELLEIIEQKTERRKQSYRAIPDDIRRAICEKVGEVAGKRPEEIALETHLASDLGLDSLDVANVHAFVDERYHIGSFAPAELTTVGDFCEAAMGRKISSAKKSEEGHGKSWPEEPSRPKVAPPEGETIQEAFLRTCDRMGKAIACADARTPPISYSRLKLTALILSQKIAAYEGEYIGILLPASVGVYIATFATLLAGKIPVMLNWTTGRRALEHADQLTQLSVVLSSRKFLDRLEELDLGTLQKKVCLLEELRETISIWDKIKGLVRSKRSAKSLMKGLSVKSTDPAVLLFTSGTETHPKGVPLSHQNILSNQKAAMGAIEVKESDILYGALPPFHSFGFSVTGLLPLLFGFRVFYSPDPLDSSTMAHDAQRHHITFFCLAPSFYKNLFAVATKEQLATVRLFVTGAEKAPQDLFDYVASLGPNHHMIEGYGITECSPIVAICPLDVPAKGVGQPIPGTELVCIHPETLELLPQGETGEVCIHGPGVFDGYFGDEQKNPFIEIDGKRWYRSGDLGSIDENGFLLLGGRLSRFVKIGGEMISLAAIEHALDDRIPKKEEDKPSHAIAVVEEEGGKTALVLFSVSELSVEGANAALREKGFGRIVKIARVRVIDEIPMTGTGKVAYRQLNQLAGTNASTL